MDGSSGGSESTDSAAACHCSSANAARTARAAEHRAAPAVAASLDGIPSPTSAGPSALSDREPDPAGAPAWRSRAAAERRACRAACRWAGVQ